LLTIYNDYEFMTKTISSFDFNAGEILSGKYRVMSLLGAGWEGEVYLVEEIHTGIERAAKFFYPQRNVRDRTSRFYAKKMYKLRQCPIVIQYHTQDFTVYQGSKITYLVSEYVEGELLSEFLKRQPGKRLSAFQAVHLLHALAAGIEHIHQIGEYHGDLHSDNIIVSRFGLGFDLKLLDMFHWGSPTKQHIRDDVVDLIGIFHESIGGHKHYARQPAEVKAICKGLKRSLIYKQFKTAGQLRMYLESMEWS
jgi:serine/threonine protein kinase